MFASLFRGRSLLHLTDNDPMNKPCKLIANQIVYRKYRGEFKTIKRTKKK